jgi:hypothetical protein
VPDRFERISTDKPPDPGQGEDDTATRGQDPAAKRRKPQKPPEPDPLDGESLDHVLREAPL